MIPSKEPSYIPVGSILTLQHEDSRPWTHGTSIENMVIQATTTGQTFYNQKCQAHKAKGQHKTSTSIHAGTRMKVRQVRSETDNIFKSFKCMDKYNILVHPQATQKGFPRSL